MAGWGTLRAENKIIDPCSTNQFGPVVFKQCLNRNAQCKLTDPPNSQMCKQFLKAVNLPEKVDIVKLEGQFCYPKKHAEDGWCEAKADNGQVKYLSVVITEFLLTKIWIVFLGFLGILFSGLSGGFGRQRKWSSSGIDPLGGPTMTAGSDHYFHTCPSIPMSLLFKIKTKQFSNENIVK